jgi:Cu(I)/Ag(I) efflux system protein CusF
MMKSSTAMTFVVALAFGASAAYAQSSPPKGAHEHGAPAPCCDNGAKVVQGYKATGVVKKVDVAKGTATIAHAPVKDLNWPAMTMAFKVKDKALLDKLPIEKKVDFTLAQEGKDYVITAVQ